MADGGYDEREPLDRTNTMNKRPERAPRTAEHSFTVSQDPTALRRLRLEEAQRKIKYYYPNHENLDLTINDSDRIVVKGSRGGNIEVFKVDGKSLLANFINKFATLGTQREPFLNELVKNLAEKKIYISEQQTISKYTSKDSSTRALAERNIKQEQDQIKQINKRISKIDELTLPSSEGIPETPTFEQCSQHNEERDKRQQELRQEKDILTRSVAEPKDRKEIPLKFTTHESSDGILIETTYSTESFTFDKDLANILEINEENRHHINFARIGIVIGAPLASVSALCGFASAGMAGAIKKLESKMSKHEKIYTLAIAKRDSISGLVSKALDDNKVTDDELRIINSEILKYRDLK
ncbi:hypothetical protein OS493_016735 [Desmophyllum pertusum]|uniref:Uncharacterized protein n=1 Tax=Desmophyllum pertusum TaxID=174260 RepID=A0A9W9Z0J7_9CNID|nr:hypothetical protein OS493_016735 [Desmophyllum pertusum]